MMRQRTAQQARRSTKTGEPTVFGDLLLQNVLLSTPQAQGMVYKLRIPVVFEMLPNWLQRVFLKMPFCTWLVPKWESRQLVLLGGYLYKFVGNKNTGPPKGSPIPMQSIDVHIVDMANNEEEEFLGDKLHPLHLIPPSGYKAVLCVSTLWKRHYFAVSDHEEASVWLRSIAAAKAEYVKRSMGHAPQDSYPLAWQHYDKLGERMLKRKERVRARVEAQSWVEMVHRGHIS